MVPMRVTGLCPGTLQDGAQADSRTPDAGSDGTTLLP